VYANGLNLIALISLNTCDSQPAYEALSVHKNFPDRQSTLLLGMKVLRIRTVLMMQFSLEINWQVAFTTNSHMLLGSCDTDYSYHVDSESYYYPVKGWPIGDKEAPSHDQYNCHHCGKMFFSTISFRHHLKVDHTERNELRCISCNDTF